MRITKLFLGLTAWLALLLVSGCTPTATQEPENNPPLELGTNQTPPALIVVNAQQLGGDMAPARNPLGYGKAIALGEDVLAVGANARFGMDDQGSVYVYRRGGAEWVEEAQLNASDADDGFQYTQEFGSALALEAGILFVGAPAADHRTAGDNTGAVYLFQESAEGWLESAKLEAPEPRPEGNFGGMLAANSAHLAVLEGRAWTGKRLFLYNGAGTGWELQTVIDIEGDSGGADSIRDFDLFGDTLVISTQTISGEQQNTEIRGRVVVFTWREGAWVQSEPLPVPDEIVGEVDLFGYLALDGTENRAERLAVSTPTAISGFMSGAIVLYTRAGEGWQVSEVLANPDEGVGGIAWSANGPVAWRGEFLLVGAPGVSEDSLWDGVAYLYQFWNGKWYHQLRLTHPEDGGFGDFFGERVAIEGNTLLIAAPSEYGNAVYVLEIGKR